MEAAGFVGLLPAPAVKRRWLDEPKVRMVAEPLEPVVTVNEVARRNGIKANHLSSWQTLARQPGRQQQILLLRMILIVMFRRVSEKVINICNLRGKRAYY